ncbi:LANO_0C02916g1_1 [Lachancea nothofagi CBS 11611]|uniref:LANO_0C02916g1_1 n=1 Tax=Lachancea nothofagi CBS 11611 TaxID=1266666 RepID=A0A1G4J5B9_9SACH|nr:LANO_0C02916g1_1 [Lachancea nothofagi CBS 11611]
MRLLLVSLLACVSARPLWVEKDVSLVMAPMVVDGMLATGQASITNYVSASAVLITATTESAVVTVPASTSSWISSTPISSSTTQSAPVQSSSSAGNAFYSGAAGIAYSPYQKNGQCKTLEMVTADMAEIQDFGIIRIYATDCNVLANLKAAVSSNQKIMVGIWDLTKISDSVTAITSAFGSDFSQIQSVSVGNELVNSGQATVQDIQTAVSSAKSQLQAIGYSGSVVSVDTLVAVTANPGLCEISDFLAVNSHPYWDGNVEPSNCGPWLKQQIANLQATCGSDKQVLITETGWPNSGDANGNCWPSPENMQTCVESINSALGSQVLLFTTYNDYWKNPGPENVEQRWGIFGDPAY